MKSGFTLLASAAAACAMMLLSSCDSAKSGSAAALATDLDSASYALGFAQGDYIAQSVKQQFAQDSALLNWGKFAAKFKQGLSADSATFSRKQVEILAEQIFMQGFSMANSLRSQGDTLNMNLVAAAFADAMNGKAVIMDARTAQKTFQDYMTNRKARLENANKEAGQKFLEENAGKEGVVTTASGLQYKVLTEGNGPKPAATDTVVINYKGTLLDGTVFDSSYDRKEPAEFVLNQVIAGWTEGVQLMNEGSKFVLWIPGDLAYAARPIGGAKAGYQLLTFECELLKVKPAKAAKK